MFMGSRPILYISQYSKKHTISTLNIYYFISQHHHQHYHTFQHWLLTSGHWLSNTDLQCSLTTMSSTCTLMSSLTTPPPIFSILLNFHPLTGNKHAQDKRTIHLCVKPSSLLKYPVIMQAKECFYTLSLHILHSQIIICSLTLRSSKTTKCIWLVENFESKDCACSTKVPALGLLQKKCHRSLFLVITRSHALWCP